MTTTNDLLTEGLTARQLHYWIMSGYLNVDRPGSGVSLDWPPEEARVARMMHVLTKAGMTTKVAAGVARTVAKLPVGERRYELSPGVWIEVAS